MKPSTWIETRSGRRFDVANPREEDIDIEDIALALAQTCRFGGHALRWISVAWHSVVVHDIMAMLREESTARLAALLHDAAEAYVGDMPRPLKLAFPDFVAAENRVQDVIHRKFGLQPSSELLSLIRKVDNQTLLEEARAYMATVDAAGNCWTKDSRFLRLPLCRPARGKFTRWGGHSWNDSMQPMSGAIKHRQRLACYVGRHRPAIPVGPWIHEDFRACRQDFAERLRAVQEPPFRAINLPPVEIKRRRAYVINLPRRMPDLVTDGLSVAIAAEAPAKVHKVLFRTVCLRQGGWQAAGDGNAMRALPACQFPFHFQRVRGLAGQAGKRRNAVVLIEEDARDP
jgi:hypothetical protein